MSFRKKFRSSIAALSIFASTLTGAASIQGASASQVNTISGRYEYIGEFIILEYANGTDAVCSQFYPLGEAYVSRFSPPSVGTNDNKWRLSLFDKHFAQHFNFNLGNYPSDRETTANISASIGRGAGAFPIMATLTITKQKPRNFSTNDEYVYLEGTLRNFGNDAVTNISEGCDVVFRMSATLRR